MSTLTSIDSFFNLLPNPKTENWKYTNLLKHLSPDILLGPTNKKTAFVNELFKKKIIQLRKSYAVFFINGVYNSKMSILPEGMTIKKRITLKENNNGFYFDSNKEGFSKNLNDSKLFNKKERLDNLLKINNLFNNNCYVIKFEAGFRCDQNIQINNIFNQKEPSLQQQRFLFLLKPNSHVKIVEQNIDFSKKSNFQNSVSEIMCSKKSFLEHSLIQHGKQSSCIVKTIFVIQKKSSKTRFYNFSLNGKLLRNNYHINLSESLSETSLFGFSCLKEKDHVDNFINIIHSAKNCNSSQLFKNIYNDTSSGVFFGGIFVGKDSQKTEAFQQNNNILLSEGARVNAVPQLEIFADDVICSHGCTIGQYDFDAIFYLQSRGMTKKDASALLSFAFLNDVFKHLSSVELQKIIRTLILKQLDLNLYS